MLSIRIFFVVALLLLAGCDPVARHQFLVTFFDEVPVFPPQEQYCQEAAKERAQFAKAQVVAKEAKPEDAALRHSAHPPYSDKRCNDCHQAEKTSVSGLLKPKNELCFMCHPAILKHSFAHGPAAEGECLGCHLPHEANFPSLLVRDPAKLCEKCHSEARLAATMHDRIKTTGVVCVDCHDPHSGRSKYFLK